MSPPTAEDARLMVQLARWGTALGIEEMLPSLFDESFDPDTADALADRPVRTLPMFGESVGTLVKHGLLSDELVHDWLWIEGIWSRVGTGRDTPAGAAGGAAAVRELRGAGRSRRLSPRS